jgi:coenzyme Q-binding protein COQ10
MHKITETKIMPFTANQIYDLVVDIENYPNFLPWCKNAKIIKEISKNNIHAELLINFKNIYEKYTSDVYFNKINENQYNIEAIAIKGPFKRLVNKWQIVLIDQKKSKVDFYLEFEFNSIILTKMLGTIFSSATHKMINAFENRANELYNPKS